MDVPDEREPSPDLNASMRRFPAVPGAFRRTQTLVVLIFGVALALRVLWAFQVECDPRTIWRWDMTVYDYQAQAFAAGSGYIDFDGKPTAHWPPGYSLALAPIYRLTSDSLLAARLANAGAGALTVLLVYLLGARIFGRTTGLIGSGLLAVCPNQVVFTSLVLTEPIFTVLFVLILLLTAYAILGDKEPKTWQVVLIGALIGAAALVRGEALLLAGVIPLLMFLRGRSWRTTLTRATPLVLAAAVVVAPWTVRNAVRMKAPIIISTSATEAFWMAHHEGASGKIAGFPITDAYKNVANPQKEVKISNEALREAVTFIRENPVKEIELIPRRFAGLYAEDSSGTLWLQTPATLSFRSGRLLREASDAFYWIVLALAVVRMPAWLSFHDPRKRFLLVVAISWTLLFIIVFFGDSRFHYSLTPIFCLWAAASATAWGEWLLRRWRDRRDSATA